MSYTSLVRIVTTNEGFEKMMNFVDEKLDLTKDTNWLKSLDEKIVNNKDDHIIFGWDSIKWYEDIRDDITAVMKSLDYINDLEIPFHYARIGQDSDDISKLDGDIESKLPTFSVDVVLNYERPQIIYDVPETENFSQEYYALYNCDDWKDYSSMRMIGVFTRDELNKQIRKRVEKGDMEFDDDNDFNNDSLSVYEINTLLKYGHVESIVINEEL